MRRPMRNGDFEYMFYFEFEASMENKEVRQLISELVEEGGKFTFLGNYTET